MKTRADRLQALCGILYQAAGAFDMPERILDFLAKAKNEGDIAEADLDGLLPCMPAQPADQIPWGEYPWAMWAAKDEDDGCFLLYSHEPYIHAGTDEWIPAGTRYTVRKTETKITGPWRESLRKRPEGV